MFVENVVEYPDNICSQHDGHGIISTLKGFNGVKKNFSLVLEEAAA